MDYPLECYRCGYDGEFPLPRKCPECGSFEVHHPDAGRLTKSSQQKA